ncbi:MAG: trigger factor [Candidatus Omnitrophica bacterium]|nr:trigger factor [Candidatus Omnitrophota bacterium]
MKKNLQKLAHCQRILEVEVTPEEISSIADEVYQDLQKSVVLPGFRKGKAPLEMVKKFYQQEAEKEILQRSILEFFQKAIANEDLAILGTPHISEVNWQGGKPLSFKALFEVKPDFTLKHYRGIKIKKKKLEIKEEEVNKVLESLREKYAELVTVEGRPSRKGDFVLCDYKSREGDRVLESRENIWLSLGEEMNVDGFAEQLCGANVGETKKISLRIPAEVSDKQLAGKLIEIEVKIKEIKEKHLPEVNDDFARTVGNFKNMAELCAGIRKDILSLKEFQTKKEMEAQVLEHLLSANRFSLPLSLVERAKENFVQRFQAELTRRGLKEKEIKEAEGVIKQKAQEEAEKEVRIFFILQKIAEKENLQVTDAEIEKHIQKLAEERKEDGKKLRERFQEKNLWEELRLELQEEKVIRLLLENAQIEEEGS